MVLNKDEAYEAALAEMKEFTYKWMPENYADPSQPILKISKSERYTDDKFSFRF